MPHFLDIDTWHRRHHFEFFKDYEQPCFNICAEVDVSRLYAITSAGQSASSFFLASLFLSLKAANAIEPFRYRLRDDSVIVHDVIHGGSTVLRHDKTFGFAYFDYHTDYSKFETSGLEILARAKAESGPLEPRTEQDDLIHYSIIPWIAFTSFTHAQRLSPRGSIPRIVFGKHHECRGTRVMPVSVEVHHALMDGLEVGRFFERYQELLDRPW